MGGDAPPTQKEPRGHKAHDPVVPEHDTAEEVGDAQPGLQAHATTTGVIVGVNDGERNFVGEIDGVILIDREAEDEMAGCDDPPAHVVALAQATHVPSVPPQNDEPAAVDA